MRLCWPARFWLRRFSPRGTIPNRNRAGNLSRSRLYVCPICGNVLHSAGGAVVSCCGVVLPPLGAEDPDDGHALRREAAEDEWLV